MEPTLEDQPARLVEDDAPVANHAARLGPFRGAAVERAEPCRELLEGERLDQVVVGTRVEALHPIADRVARGQHEDRQLGAAGPQPARNLGARDVRQPDIKDHRVDPAAGLGNLERIGAAGRQLDEMALLAEQARQEAAEPRIVLHQQQMHDAPRPQAT